MFNDVINETVIGLWPAGVSDGTKGKMGRGGEGEERKRVNCI